MRTTPRSFYELFVIPNMEDYRGQPDDVRLGFNAALSAFQLADIFYAFYQRERPAVVSRWTKLKDLHIHLTSVEPCYLTVQSVATVYKHLYANHGHYEVGTPGALWGVSLPRAEVKLESTWGDATDVLVKRRKGDTVSLMNALNRVVDEMWPNFLPQEP